MKNSTVFFSAKLIFIAALLTASSFAQTIAPDSIRAVWIPNTNTWADNPPRVIINRTILAKARELHYNYAAITLVPGPLYWNYWESHGFDPFITSGPFAGTMTLEARRYYKGIIKNACRQLDSFNLKLIPFLVIGQHAYISGWPLMSERMELNYKRFDNAKRNRPLSGACGFPVFMEDMRTYGPSRARYDRTTYLRTITDTVVSGDMAFRADSLGFIFQQCDGASDCSWSAQLVGITGHSANAKAGVMIRDSLAAGSRYAMICATPANMVRFQYRSASGGSTKTGAAIHVSLPVFLKMQRTRNRYEGLYSSDGTHWTVAGSADITFDERCFDDFVGIAASSGSQTSPCIGTFERATWFPSGKPVASSPFAPDTAVGGFDRVFESILTIVKEAFTEVQAEPGFSYHALEYVHIGEDECITDADTSKAYFLMGECPVDQRWIQDRYMSQFGGSIEKTVQNLMGSEVKRRVAQIQSSIGPSTKMMLFADMWDKNMYDSKDNQLYPALSPCQYPNPSSISTWGVINTDSARSVAGSIILQPWKYDAPASYNTFDTYASFKAKGFKFQFVWSRLAGNRPDNVAMLKQFIKNNRLPDFKNHAIGYFYADFTGDSDVCVKGMEYNAQWDK